MLSRNCSISCKLSSSYVLCCLQCSHYPFDIFRVFNDIHGFIPDISNLCLFFLSNLLGIFLFLIFQRIRILFHWFFFYCFLFSILLKIFLLCLLLPSFYLLWIYFAFLFQVLKLGARLFTYKKWLSCVCVLVAQSCPTLGPHGL